jgi:hypothetical protein
MAAAYAATPVNPMQQASEAQRAALAGTATAGTVAGSSLTPYMNPYTTNVINQSMADLERQRLMQQGQIGAQATRAGAFGGSREAVQRALTNEAFARQGGLLSSQLRQQGFQSAQQMAQQDIANRMQQAAQLGALGGQSFGYGQQIQSGLSQQGQMQQALQQAVIDAAKGQYAGYTGAPATSLGYVATTLGAAPTPTSSTSSGQQQQSTGIFDALTSGALLGKAFGFF